MQKYSGIPAVQEKCKELQGWLDKCDYSTADATFWDKMEELADFVQECLLDQTKHKEAEQETESDETSDSDDGDDDDAGDDESEGASWEELESN